MDKHSKEQASSIFEAESSMLNSVTFQSEDIEYFEACVLPMYEPYRPPLIIKLSGETANEFVQTAEKLNKWDKIVGFEINLSCPDINDNRQIFGLLSESTHNLIRKIRNVIGTLSCSAIRPLIVRLIFQVHQISHLPIIGSGGVMTDGDAIEMLLAGATAVQIGAANYHNSTAMVEIIREIRDYLISKDIHSVSSLVGQVDLN